MPDILRNHNGLSSYWENIDHNDPEQLKRQKYARDNNRITTVSINKNSKTGVFQGTSWTTYNVSLKSCTCADFEQRKLPCKHIYRLAYELGIIKRPERIPHGIGKADKETTRKDLGLPPGKIFHIWYMDIKGNISERDIEIQKIAEVKDKTYIYGYCHWHNATRSFLTSRILLMTYNGRPIKDFHDIFQMDFSTPKDFIEKLVKEALEIEEPSSQNEEINKANENTELLEKQKTDVPLTADQIIDRLPEEEARLLKEKVSWPFRVEPFEPIVTLVELKIIYEMNDTPETALNFYKIDDIKEMLKSRNLPVPTARKWDVIRPIALEQVGDLLVSCLPEKTSSKLYKLNPVYESIWNLLMGKINRAYPGPRLYYDGLGTEPVPNITGRCDLEKIKNQNNSLIQSDQHGKDLGSVEDYFRDLSPEGKNHLFDYARSFLEERFSGMAFSTPADFIENIRKKAREITEIYNKNNERKRFVYNDVEICTIDNLVNYLQPIITDKFLLEFNKEKKRVALYKAEYYKNGDPKYIIRNKITFIEYSNDLDSFNVADQRYMYFDRAGPSFIARVEKALKDIHL